MGNLLSSGTQIQIGGITCWDEGTEENFERTRRWATRRLLCEWTSRAELINAIRGGATAVAGVYMYDTVPYPDFPDLYPEKFSVKGVGAMSVGAAGGPAYQWARVEVTYSSMSGAESQGQVGLDFSTNMIALPKSGPCLQAVGVDDHDRLPVSPADTPGLPLVVVCISRSIRNLGNLPMSTIASIAAAPLNNAPVFGYAAGCVLFDGGRATRQSLSKNGTGIGQAGINPRFNPVGADGGLEGVWDVEYRFLARPALPWDHLGFRIIDEFAFRQVEFINVNPATGTKAFIGRSDLNRLFPQSGNLFPTPV